MNEYKNYDIFSLIEEKIKNCSKEKKLLILVPSRYRAGQILNYLKEKNYTELVEVKQFEDFVIYLYGKKNKPDKKEIFEILDLPLDWWQFYIILLYRHKKGEQQTNLQLFYQYKQINEDLITGTKIAHFIREYIRYRFPEKENDIDKDKEIGQTYEVFFNICKDYFSSNLVDENKCFYDVINKFDNYTDYFNNYSYLILENLYNMPAMFQKFVDTICQHFEKNGKRCEKINFVERVLPTKQQNSDTQELLMKLLDDVKKNKDKCSFYYGITMLDEIQWILEKIEEIYGNDTDPKKICIVTDNEQFISQFEFATEIYNSAVGEEKTKIRKEFFFKYHIIWQTLNSIANYFRGYFTEEDLEVILTSPVSKYKVDDDLYTKYIRPYLIFRMTQEEIYLPHDKDINNNQSEGSKVLKVMLDTISNLNIPNDEKQKIKNVFESVNSFFYKLEKIKEIKLSKILEDFIDINNISEDKIGYLLKEAKSIEEKMQSIINNKDEKNQKTGFETFDFVLKFLSLKTYKEQEEGIFILPPNEAQFLKFSYVFIPDLTEKIDDISPSYLPDEILSELSLPNSLHNSMTKKIQILNCIKNSEKGVYLSSHKVEQQGKEVYHSFLLEGLEVINEEYKSNDFLYRKLTDTQK